MAGCGEMIGIGCRRPITERGMRPGGVVVSDPGSDGMPSLIEIEKQAFIEKLVAHPAIEGFDVAVLHRLAWRNVVPFELMLLAPAQDCVRGELGAVVRHDHLRLAAPLDERRKLPDYPPARDRGVWDGCQTLPGHVIDDVEDAEATTAGELVLDEVERPAGIRLGLDRDRRSSSYCLAAASAFAHSQSLLAIEPIDAVDAGWLAVGSQQDEEPPIAEPAPSIGKLTQPGTQRRVRRPT